jgi:hypothetical protein
MCVCVCVCVCVVLTYGIVSATLGSYVVVHLVALRVWWRHIQFLCHTEYIRVFSMKVMSLVCLPFVSLFYVPQTKEVLSVQSSFSFAFS